MIHKHCKIISLHLGVFYLYYFTDIVSLLIFHHCTCHIVFLHSIYVLLGVYASLTPALFYQLWICFTASEDFVFDSRVNYDSVHYKIMNIWFISMCNSFFIMMTSSNCNIFRVTGPFCGEFTGHQWIPRTESSDVSVDLHLNKRRSKPASWWFKKPSRLLWRHCNDKDRKLAITLIIFLEYKHFMLQPWGFTAILFLHSWL